MERYVKMESPLTGGKVKEISTTEIKEFRKEKYSVHVRYFVCEDTGEQFTTTEQDTLLFNDLYSQYRVRHGIPFPDEIKDIRVKYGLNYSQISKILGFGANQYAKYENGEIPSESNGKMIAAIRNKNVLLGILKSGKESFQASEYQRILTLITMGEESEDKYSALREIIYRNESRSIFNGYGPKDVAKLFDIVRYVITKHGEIFPTKLNKLLFYSDFYNYRKTGQSISGLQYRALSFGPVPDHYATIYDNIPGVKKRMIESHGMIGTLLDWTADSDFKTLTHTEKESIEHVVSVLKPLSVSEIIDASHKEDGWIKASVAHCHIPYDEAFYLRLI